jgi:hypothetical protein
MACIVGCENSVSTASSRRASNIPQREGNRAKTNRWHSESLARLLRTGEFAPVWAPCASRLVAASSLLTIMGGWRVAVQEQPVQRMDSQLRQGRRCRCRYAEP